MVYLDYKIKKWGKEKWKKLCSNGKKIMELGLFMKLQIPKLQQKLLKIIWEIFGKM